MTCWTLHALDGCSFAYVVDKGRGYQVLTLDEKHFRRQHSKERLDLTTVF